MRIAVIGAGLSGLSFAHSVQRFADIQLFEKSRGVGGRLATRRAADYEFDHGAQFFTCRSKALKSLRKEDDFQSAVSEWQPKLVTLAPDSETFKRTWFEPHYVGAPSMTAFPRRLARGLAISYSTRVRRISRRGSQWQLKDENGSELGVFDCVVSAIPAPQVDMLFGAKFNWFSKGYLAYDNEKDLIIDVRYSAIPNEAEGLWGIKINPDPNYKDHVKWVVNRENFFERLPKLKAMLFGNFCNKEI